MSLMDEITRPDGMVKVDVPTTAALVREIVRQRKALQEICNADGAPYHLDIAKSALEYNEGH